VPSLWVTQYVITYDGKPTYTVSIMELRDGKVQRETQYFGEAFEPPAWRVALGRAAGEPALLPAALVR
jgi:hypothetical protein